MKTKLQTPTIILFLIVSMTAAIAQSSGSASVGTVPINPTTGLPMATGPIDPVTGLPANGSPPFMDKNGAPTWIQQSWPDPTKVVSLWWPDGLPVSEVARYLHEQFTNTFDIIMPATVFDATTVKVKLELENVTASEIFRAMNMQFELDNTPLRWELTWNDSRPTALLRYLPQLVPKAPPAPETKRMVFFVGDLIGANQSGQQISEMITGVFDAAFGNSEARWIFKIQNNGMIGDPTIQFYDPAQLLIVTGTPVQMDFIEQTLAALRQKAETARQEQSKSGESKPQTEAPTTGGASTTN